MHIANGKRTFILFFAPTRQQSTMFTPLLSRRHQACVRCYAAVTVGIKAVDACASPDTRASSAISSRTSANRIATVTGSACKARVNARSASRASSVTNPTVTTRIAATMVPASTASASARPAGRAATAQKLINACPSSFRTVRIAACLIWTRSGAFASPVGLATIVHSVRTLIYEFLERPLSIVGKA